jgi:hypothetical protein
MRNWTYSKTISSAETFTIDYRKKVGSNYETATDSVPHVAVSEVFTNYTTITYVDQDNKVQTQDVVSSTITRATTCVGAANLARWKSKLEAGSPAYAGTTLIKSSESYNVYKITPEGPVEVSLTTYEYEPLIAFAGGMPIEDYKGVDLGTGNTLVRKTIVEKEENKLADLTKEITTVYEAWGATAAGKAGASALMKAVKGAANDNARVTLTLQLVDAMKALVLRNVEQTINIGRGVAPALPTPQDQQNEKLERAQTDITVEGPWGISSSKSINGSIDTDKVEVVTLSFNNNYGNDN